MSCAGILCFLHVVHIMDWADRSLCRHTCQIVYLHWCLHHLTVSHRSRLCIICEGDINEEVGIHMHWNLSIRALGHDSSAISQKHFFNIYLCIEILI